jgi:hypothetical protein
MGSIAASGNHVAFMHVSNHAVRSFHACLILAKDFEPEGTED